MNDGEGRMIAESEVRAAFAARLGSWMDENGVGGAALARRMGVGHSNVSAWLHGVQTPQAYMLFLLCDATGLSADWLLGLGER